jgi:hypothetical protein
MKIGRPFLRFLPLIAFVLLTGSLAYGQAAVAWPPVLNPDPSVEPPKWDWQLATPIKINTDSTVQIYDIDMFENEHRTAIQTLHSKGYRVICYVDSGSWENWRDDAAAFPASILGKNIQGFPTRNGWTSVTSTRQSRKPGLLWRQS